MSRVKTELKKMAQEPIIHHVDTLLTKATATSIAASSGSEIIVRTHSVSYQVETWLTENAIPIGAASTILLTLAKLLTIYFESKRACNDELRKDTIFNATLEEKRLHIAADTGERRRIDDDKT